MSRALACELLTLVFTISTLHFFMHPFLNLALENTGSCRLVEPGSFENMCSIYPIIASSSHNTVTLELVFIYWDLLNKVRRCEPRTLRDNTRSQDKEKKEKAKTHIAISSRIDPGKVHLRHDRRFCMPALDSAGSRANSKKECDADVQQPVSFQVSVTQRTHNWIPGHHIR